MAWNSQQSSVDGLILGPFSAYPYASASLACHALLLSVIFGLGTYRIDQAAQAANQARVDASTAQAIQTDLQRRVRDMARIREMLAQSNEKEGAGKRPHRDADPVKDDRAQLRAPVAKTPEAFLEEAKEITAAIKKLEQQFKAAELANVLKVPEGEALKQVVAADAATAEKRDIEKQAPAPAASSLEQLEQQAKDALARRRHQIAQRQGGISVRNGSSESFLQQSAGDGEFRVAGRLPRGGSIDFSDSSSFTDERRYGAYLAAPHIDKANLNMAMGNVFGKDGGYANRVWVNRWYVIGPFQGSGPDSLSNRYAPELSVDLDGVYFGKYKRPLRWEFVHANSYPFVPSPPAENAVYYGYTEIIMDEERDLWVTIGADDDSKVWFNNRLVWTSGEQDKPWYHAHFRRLTDDIANMNLSEGKRKLHFNKGRNTLLFKLYNGSGAMFFSLVIEAV